MVLNTAVPRNSSKATMGRSRPFSDVILNGGEAAMKDPTSADSALQRTGKEGGRWWHQHSKDATFELKEQPHQEKTPVDARCR
jgi:hypothetical protein